MTPRTFVLVGAVEALALVGVSSIALAAGVHVLVVAAIIVVAFVFGVGAFVGVHLRAPRRLQCPVCAAPLREELERCEVEGCDFRGAPIFTCDTPGCSFGDFRCRFVTTASHADAAVVEPAVVEPADWLPSVEELRAMLRAKAPHLPCDVMTLGEVWIALGKEHEPPRCPHCQRACLVTLDSEDAEDAPRPADMTHRCAACGKQCRWEAA